MPQQPSSSVRSVRIDDDERGGWSSDRRPGGERVSAPRGPKPVRCVVLAPQARLSYRPGALVVVAGPDAAARAEFISRVFPPASALTSEKVAALLAGTDPQQREAKAAELLSAAARRRLAAGKDAVVEGAGLTVEERRALAELANYNRHFILLDNGAGVDADTAKALAATRALLDAGRLGEEGFSSALRLAPGPAAAVKVAQFGVPSNR